MFRKFFSYGGTLLLAGAVMLFTPGLGLSAGHGGGGHVGGGHFGGGHVGIGHVGVGHFGGSGYPGYGHWDGHHYGYHHYWPHYGYFFSYPYMYGTYPYSYAYPYSDYLYYPDMSSTTGNSADYGGYPDNFSTVTPPVVDYESATVPADIPAKVTVNVPVDAQLWFNGTPTTSTGAVRQFTSPPLTPSKRYSYEVRASWKENGREITQMQKVGVTAGAHANVSFPNPSKGVAQAPAQKG
jgi:uncharacterized protein (TIGR03000 family)